MSSTLVILAAGMSSRFAPGLKQLTTVGPSGETLMDYCLYDAVLAGFESVVVVVRHELRSEFEARLAHWSKRLSVRVAEQSHGSMLSAHPALRGRQRPLGTVHAVLCARSAVPGPFAIMNADDYYGPDAFYRMAGALGDAGARASVESVNGWLAGYRLADTLSASGGVTRAVCAVSHDGYLQSVEEAYDVREAEGRITGVIADRRQQLEGAGIVSTNLWGFAHGAFDLMQQSLDRFLQSGPGEQDELRIADAVTEWLERGQATIRVLPAAGAWFGLTHGGDLDPVRDAVADLIRTHAYPPSLFDPAASETSGSLG